MSANGGPKSAFLTAREIVLILAAGVTVAALPFLPGLFGALVLFIVLVPLHVRLARLTSTRTSALILTAGCALVIVVPGSWLVATVGVEAAELLKRAESAAVMDRLAGTRIGGIEVGAQLERLGSGFLAWLSARTMSIFESATRAVLNMFIAHFGLFYLLLQGRDAWPGLKRYLPFPDDTAERLRVRFVAVTDAMLLGTLLTAALQGTIVGIGFALVGLRGPVLWGVVTAVVSVLPLFGSALVWLPGVIALAVDHRFTAALLLLALGGGIASNLDNIIRPIVYRRVSGLHPMITLVGALAGVGVFGLIGVLLGPLALAYCFELLRVHGPSRGQSVLLPSFSNLPEPAPAAAEPRS